MDHVKYEDGKWSYTTVGNKPAVGLCGSGLIDLVAGLLDAGMLDENGVLSSGQGKKDVFMLVPPEWAGNGRGVYLTQKDLGEVQLAKAAIAAGIRMLMERLGLQKMTSVRYILQVLLATIWIRSVQGRLVCFRRRL